MKFRAIAMGMLAAACLGSVGNSDFCPLANPATAEASAIKHKTFSTNEAKRRDINYLKRYTILSQDEITSMMAQGNSKEDIETLYILHSFLPDKDYQELQKMYLDAGKNVDAILDEQKIDKDQFHSTVERAFPEEETDFDRVQRIKNLRHQKF